MGLLLFFGVGVVAAAGVVWIAVGVAVVVVAGVVGGVEWLS